MALRGAAAEHPDLVHVQDKIFLHNQPKIKVQISIILKISSFEV